MTTALDIIHGALRLLQVKSSDASLTAEEANDALDSLNTMIDSWSLDGLMVTHATKESFILTPGQSTYTIGTGGNFDTSRPVDILQATFAVMPSIVAIGDGVVIAGSSVITGFSGLTIDAYSGKRIYTYLGQYIGLCVSNTATTITLTDVATIAFTGSIAYNTNASLINSAGVDYGVSCVGFDDYAAVRLKSLSTAYVEQLYYEKSFPLGNIYLYPVPSSASTLTIYSNKQLTEFTSLTDTFVFPNAYKKAMKYALAMDLAPEYQRDPGDDVRRQAVGAIAAIKRMNRKVTTMQPDSAVMANSRRNRFNIFKGA